MPNKTFNIKEYRKQYYLENRDHLLLYQKMYVFYKKLEMKYKIENDSKEELKITFKEKKKTNKEHDEKITKTIFKKGKFTLHFD